MREILIKFRAVLASSTIMATEHTAVKLPHKLPAHCGAGSMCYQQIHKRAHMYCAQLQNLHILFVEIYAITGKYLNSANRQKMLEKPAAHTVVGGIME